MITTKTVEKLIDNYEEIIATAERCGYRNLMLYAEDSDTIHFFAEQHKIQGREDINAALSALLGGAPVSLITKYCLAALSFVQREACNTPLSDMAKVIDLFCEVLIPAAADHFPSNKEQADLQARWQRKQGLEQNGEAEEAEDAKPAEPAEWKRARPPSP